MSDRNSNDNPQWCGTTQPSSSFTSDLPYSEQVIDIAQASLQQEAYFCDLAQQGNEQAVARLVTQHLPLIVSLAHRAVQKSNVKASMLDLVAVGKTAFENAVQQFNEHYGIRLEKFASVYITDSIKREISTSSEQTKLPIYIQKQIQQISHFNKQQHARY